MTIASGALAQKITINEQYMRLTGDMQEIICTGDPEINSTKEIASIEIFPIGKLDFGRFTLERVTFLLKERQIRLFPVQS